MRYLVTARVRPGKESVLLRAVEEGTLGLGSVAGDEYVRAMESARLVALPAGTAGPARMAGSTGAAGSAEPPRSALAGSQGPEALAAAGAEVARWVEVCFCDTPLAEERPYWEEYFELLRVQDAHHRKHCRDLSGEEPWACVDCDCTARLEERLQHRGEPFLPRLRRRGNSG